MQIKYTFKHMDSTPSVSEYAEAKFSRLEKFSLHKDPRIHFIFSVDKDDKVAEIIIDAGHVHHEAIARDPDMHAAVDAVIDKIERQLQKHKEKVQDHRKSIPTPKMEDTE